MYDTGTGVPQNHKEAVKWYAKAAERGYAAAQGGLGTMYDEGRGVPQDDKEAVKWYTKAAEQGDTDAQHNLAIMYGTGDGVPQNDVYAHMWANIASADGNENAHKIRSIIAASMAPDQLAEAQTLATECIKKDYKNC